MSPGVHEAVGKTTTCESSEQVLRRSQKKPDLQVARGRKGLKLRVRKTPGTKLGQVP